MLSVTLMSSVYHSADYSRKEVKEVSIEPSAYLNLVTFQKGDMKVYSTVDLNSSKVNSFRNLAENKLGSKLRIGKSNEKFSSYSEKDPSAFYEQDIKSGILSFNKGMNALVSGKTQKLPEQKQANQLALNFIHKNRLSSKNNGELKLMHSGGLRRSDAGSTIVKDVLRTITYGRMLDNTPVYGVGSKIVVHVGNNGEIVGMNSRWKEVASNKTNSVSKKDMKSSKVAEGEMNKKLQKEFGREAKFKINEMSLAYYDGGKNVIQPAYFFRVMVTLPKKGKEKIISFDYLGIIQAMKRSPEAIEILQNIPPEALNNVRTISAKNQGRVKVDAKNNE